MGNLSETDDEIQGLGIGLKFNNFKIEDVDVEEAINITIVLDNSGSIGDCIDELNSNVQDMIAEFQRSHHAPKIFVQIVKFGSEIEVVNGFQPIGQLKQHTFNANMGTTRLYDAVHESLVNALNYANSLESSGVLTKTFVYVITDGDDTDSARDTAPKIKALIDDIKKDERKSGNFISILFGIGSTGSFQHAKDLMGFQQMYQVGTSATEIRKMIGIISASVSSATAAGPGAAVNF